MLEQKSRSVGDVLTDMSHTIERLMRAEVSLASAGATERVSAMLLRGAMVVAALLLAVPERRTAHGRRRDAAVADDAAMGGLAGRCSDHRAALSGGGHRWPEVPHAPSRRFPYCRSQLSVDMPHTTLDIARQIIEDRRRLDRNVAELRGLASAAMDWRTHVRGHLMLSLGAAVSGGILLAHLTAPRRRAGEPIPLHSVRSDHEMPHASRGPGPLASLATALVTAASRALVSRVEDEVQRFHFERRTVAARDEARR